MTITAVIGVLFGLLAVWYLWRFVVCLRRRRLLRAGGASIGCLGCAAVAAAATILALSYRTYARLVEEQVVSRIEFRRIDGDRFEARLMIPDQTDRFFELRGDEWQIDARIVTWQPPMTVLGLDPIYQLDRLSGRFADIERERSEARTVHSLAPDLPADVWTLAHRFPAFTPGIDAHYGTATYVPMADGARFEVSLSRDALIARPVNQRARDALGTWRTQER